MLLHKKIARSNNQIDLDHNILNIKTFCEKNNLSDFLVFYITNWLNDKWLYSWIDMNRPGGRIGLGNTNNASESFFKQLLYFHLKSKKRYLPDVISIILCTVFEYYENNILKPRYQKNKSQKMMLYNKKYAKQCFKDQQIEFINDSFIITQKKGDKTKIFEVKNFKCTCFTFIWNGRCKHIAATDYYINNSLDNIPLTEKGNLKSGPNVTITGRKTYISKKNCIGTIISELSKDLDLMAIIPASDNDNNRNIKDSDSSVIQNIDDSNISFEIVEKNSISEDNLSNYNDNLIINELSNEYSNDSDSFLIELSDSEEISIKEIPEKWLNPSSLKNKNAIIQELVKRNIKYSVKSSRTDLLSLYECKYNEYYTQKKTKSKKIIIN